MGKGSGVRVYGSKERNPKAPPYPNAPADDSAWFQPEARDRDSSLELKVKKQGLRI